MFYIFFAELSQEKLPVVNMSRTNLHFALINFLQNEDVQLCNDF